MFLYAPETRIYGQWRWMKWESMVTHDSISSGTHMHTSVLYFTQQLTTFLINGQPRFPETDMLSYSHTLYLLSLSFPTFFTTLSSNVGCETIGNTNQSKKPTEWPAKKWKQTLLSVSLQRWMEDENKTTCPQYAWSQNLIECKMRSDKYENVSRKVQ